MSTFSPDLILAGSYKCGTTSLYRWLDADPHFVASIAKEPQYFRGGETADIRWHPPESPTFASGGIEGYAQCWSAEARANPAVHLFEATPFYLYDSTALENIAALTPAPRVAFLLREPASRAFSLYNAARHKAGTVPNGLSFAEVVDRLLADPGDPLFASTAQLSKIVRHGDYARYLQPWTELMGDRVRVYWFDDLATEPLSVLDDLVSWVNPELAFDRSVPLDAANQTTVSKYPAVRRVVRRVVQRGDNPLVDRLRNNAAVGAAYRRLNRGGTRPETSDSDRATLTKLIQHFQPANQRLAELGFAPPAAWEQDA